MTSKSTALLLGGLLPAFIYGGSAIFQKMSTNLGISLSYCDRGGDCTGGCGLLLGR